MPSVWHILVRVCCDAVFSSVFYPIGAMSDGGYTDSPNGCRVGRRIYSLLVPIGLLVCPPLYLMFILWLLGVKIRYVICLFVVMSAVTGRTHVNWRYRTLKARRDSTMRCRLGLRPRSLFRISLFALLTQICLWLINLYLQFRFKW